MPHVHPQGCHAGRRKGRVRRAPEPKRGTCSRGRLAPESSSDRSAPATCTRAGPNSGSYLEMTFRPPTGESTWARCSLPPTPYNSCKMQQIAPWRETLISRTLQRGFHHLLPLPLLGRGASGGCQSAGRTRPLLQHGRIFRFPLLG